MWVSADSLREALHPTEYGARTLLGRGEAVAGLALCCHGPAESKGAWEEQD